MCKMISPAVFSFFENSDFWGFYQKDGVKRAKNDPKLTILVCHVLILKNCRSRNQDFRYTCAKSYLQVCFSILKKNTTLILKS